LFVHIGSPEYSDPILEVTGSSLSLSPHFPLIAAS
jgi:hypothetical protein